MVKMNKLIKLVGVDTPFEIQTITAATANTLMKRNTGLFGQMNSIGFTEDLTFVCTVYPKFNTKQELLESLLPGQFNELLEQIVELNGYNWAKEKKAVKSNVRR